MPNAFLSMMKTEEEIDLKLMDVLSIRTQKAMK